MQLRTSLGLLATPFPYLIALIVALEAFGGPTYVMSDAAIVGAATDDGDYGRCRVWACLAWGVAGAACSPLMHFTSFRYAFLAYGVVSLFAIAAGTGLDFSFVSAPHDSALEGDAAVCETGDAAGSRDERFSVPRAESHEGRGFEVPCSRRSVSGAQSVCAAEPVAAADLQPPILAAEAAALQRSSGGSRGSCSIEDLPRGMSLTACAPVQQQREAGAINEPLLMKAHAASGSVANAGQQQLTFGQKYWSLLQQRAMLFFLAKALLMGVRPPACCARGQSCVQTICTCAQSRCTSSSRQC